MLPSKMKNKIRRLKNNNGRKIIISLITYLVITGWSFCRGSFIQLLFWAYFGKLINHRVNDTLCDCYLILQLYKYTNIRRKRWYSLKIDIIYTIIINLFPASKAFYHFLCYVHYWIDLFFLFMELLHEFLWGLLCKLVFLYW